MYLAPRLLDEFIGKCFRMIWLHPSSIYPHESCDMTIASRHCNYFLENFVFSIHKSFWTDGCHVSFHKIWIIWHATCDNVACYCWWHATVHQRDTIGHSTACDFRLKFWVSNFYARTFRNPMPDLKLCLALIFVYISINICVYWLYLNFQT